MMARITAERDAYSSHHTPCDGMGRDAGEEYPLSIRLVSKCRYALGSDRRRRVWARVMPYSITAERDGYYGSNRLECGDEACDYSLSFESRGRDSGCR